MNLALVATVPADMRDVVEALFFFNPRQGILIKGIRAAVEQSGSPEILECEGRLWIGVPSGTLQCLFAVDLTGEPERPVGVILYDREPPDIISIRHLAVDPDYGSGGAASGGGLGVFLIEKVREIGRRINGVKRVKLPYRKQLFLPV